MFFRSLVPWVGYMGIALVTFSVSAHALSGSTKVAATKALMRSCIKSMHDKGQGRTYTADKISRYCSCVGMKTADRLKNRDVGRYFKSHGTGTVRMQDMNVQVSRQCARRYLK